MIKTGLKEMVVAVAAFLCLAGCTDVKTKQRAEPSAGSDPVQTETIAKEAAYSDLFLDSAALEQFISAQSIDEKRVNHIRDFYKSRGYQFAWFSGDGLTEHGRVFWNLHNQFVNYARDSSFFNQHLHEQMKKLLDDGLQKMNQQQVKETELALTEHFFDYAQYAFAGKVDPVELKWYIPRKKINPVALLDSLIEKNGKDLDKWQPLNQKYKTLRTVLLRYHAIEKSGGWKAIPTGPKVYKPGDSAAAIELLKERLFLVGDYTEEDRSPLFTPALKVAVQQAQSRFGLAADGVAGAATLRELNKPVTERIRQMLVNMERMRWMPAHSNGKRLVANIPEYKLHVYEGNQEMFNMRIVVGKAANKTVVFNDQLKHIVFSPYWNVPASIVRNEILPAMTRNAGYLQRNNMEQTGTAGGLPVIRQKPGPGNALGKVKFIFPNSYAIYFHDTPAKSLFERHKRAFSHGCIRLQEPRKLANYLLQDREGWTDKKTAEAMNGSKEMWVNLDQPVPVVITYFTAWADNEGRAHFREDIYGHDKALAAKLF